MRARIETALGAGVSGKRLADLMSLAQFQMLSRDARAFRSPTVVLSMRPLRSVTMRCFPPLQSHLCFPEVIKLYFLGRLGLDGWGKGPHRVSETNRRVCSWHVDKFGLPEVVAKSLLIGSCMTVCPLHRMMPCVDQH